MDHNDIRHKLSEFIDGAVTPGEKTEIEQHLKTCTECSEALRELRKTIEHIHAIEEVESPAWMTQKIMAKVRTEAERKKGLFHRLFYPLAVKLPIQTVAVLFLAVTAYYIYNSIEPARKYAEEPVGMLAKKEAPAVQRMKEENKTVREAVPEAKQDSRKPGYKSLDMKYEYEKPAPPVPEEQPAASAPALAKRESPMSATDEAVLESRAFALKAKKSAAPSLMAEQAASSAGTAAKNAEKPMTAAQSRKQEMADKTAPMTAGAAVQTPSHEEFEADAAAQKTIIEYFAAHDLPASMRKKGLTFTSHKVHPSLHDTQFLDAAIKRKIRLCKNSYVVNVDFDKIKQQYFYCYDSKIIELLGKYEQKGDSWLEIK